MGPIRVGRFLLSHERTWRTWRREDRRRRLWLARRFDARREAVTLMSPVNIWKRLLALLFTLRSISEHDCSFKMSFVKVEEKSDFSYHNLPYGVFSTPDNVSTRFNHSVNDGNVMFVWTEFLKYCYCSKSVFSFMKWLKDVILLLVLLPLGHKVSKVRVHIEMHPESKVNSFIDNQTSLAWLSAFITLAKHIVFKVFGPSIIMLENMICHKMIDDQLNFPDRITKTARSCRFVLYNIKKIRPFLWEHATQLLVQALVLSTLDYCNALLAGLPASSIKPPQLTQNTAARLIFNEPKRTHVTPLFISLHWLPIAAQCIKFKALMFAYRSTSGSAPLYLNSLLQTYMSSRSLRSASERRITVPSQRDTKSLSQTFSLTVPIWWPA